MITFAGSSGVFSPFFLILFFKTTLVPGWWFEFFGAIDLNAKKASSMISLAGGWNGDFKSRNYGLNWKFDSSTKFYFCTEDSGIATMTCFVKSFAIWYAYGDTFTFATQYMWGFSRIKTKHSKCLKLIAVLLGAYVINEGNGFILTDSVGNIGDGQFGEEQSFLLSKIARDSK